MFEFNVEIKNKKTGKQIVLSNEFGWVGYDIKGAKALISDIQSAVFQIEKDRYFAKLKSDLASQLPS